jgi:hypothetical protein
MHMLGQVLIQVAATMHHYYSACSTISMNISTGDDHHLSHLSTTSMIGASAAHSIACASSTP